MHRTASFIHRRLALTAVSAAVACLASLGCGSSSSGSAVTCDFTQASQIFATKGCNLSGCHDGTATGAAHFDMTTTGWQNNLVGKSPMGNGPLAACTAADGNYLDKGSNPATGLLIDKLAMAHPPCGVQMPYLQPSNVLNAHDLACVTSWATMMTTAP